MHFCICNAHRFRLAQTNVISTIMKYTHMTLYNYDQTNSDNDLQYMTLIMYNVLVSLPLEWSIKNSTVKFIFSCTQEFKMIINEFLL